MARMLIIGGSHSDQPLIESALLNGLEVYTTGNRPDHPGHRLAHGYQPGDFSKPEEILAIARQLDVDHVVPGANDFAMLSAAYVAEKMALPGYDSFATAEVLHLKDRFKDFSSALGMPVCKYVVLDPESTSPIEDKLRGLSFPIMIKPIDLTGGKGITRVECMEGIEAAIANARALSRHAVLVAEEWFDGTLHSYSTIIENGEIVFEYLDTELCLFNEHLVSTSLSLCNIPADARRQLRAATAGVVRELGLVDGVLHSQFLANDRDIRILEYTRRMSGDLYSKVVQMVRGFRHGDVFIASALGRPLAPLLKAVQPCQRFVARHCVTAQQAGRFSRLLVADHIRPYVKSITMSTAFDAEVAADGRGKVAVVIVSFLGETEIMEFANTCKQDFTCEVK